MKRTVLLAAAVSLALIACGEKKSASPATHPTNPASAGGNPLTAPVDYLGAVGKAQKVAEKTADLTTLNQAIRLFHASEDRYPKDLNELVSEGYLPRLPTLRAGTKLEYNPARGEVRIAPQ